MPLYKNISQYGLIVDNNAGDNAAVSYHADGTSIHVVPKQGYTDGVDDASVITDADFVAGNILSGVNIFGKDGSATAAVPLTGDAAVGDVLTGKTFYNTDQTVKETGTMTNNAGNNVEVTTVAGTTISAGYYNGSGKAVLSAAEAAKVVEGNIKSGVTLLGVAGNANVVDTTSGDAAAGEILTGKKAWVDGSEVTGTMADNEGNNACSSSSVDGTTLKLVAPTGFYDGTDTVTITDADFVEGKIKAGSNIFGIVGTYETTLTGDADVGDVLSGKLFYKDDATSQLTGTMANKGANNVEVTDVDGTLIPAGYYDGTGSAVLSAAEAAKVVEGNIKSGVTLLGVAGSANVVDTSSGDATAGQILTGKKAWVDGSEVTGTMADNAGDVAAVSSHSGGAGTIHVIPAAGYVDGVDDATVITDAEFIAANIAVGANIFGIDGTHAGASVLTGDAEVGNVLDGKFFYKDDPDSKLEGTMPNNAGDVAAVSTHAGAAGEIHAVAAAGYTDGVDDAVVLTDADFAAGNIKTGVDIFGVEGTYDTEAVNPIAAGTVLDGKIGFVNGSKITGTLALTGDAAVGNVLAGKTYYKDDATSQQTGTMVNNAGDTAATSTHAGAAGEIHAVAPEGYYDGVDDALVLTDADFTAGNIKDGVTIFGVEGTLAGSSVLTGDAVEANVLATKTFYSNDPDSKLTGTMVNNAGDTACLSYNNDGTTLKLLASAGFYDGINDNVTVTDADWVVTNIKTGVDIFGITGTYVTPLTGDAAIGNVLTGKTFYKDDATSKLTGTMPNNAGDNASLSYANDGTTLKLVAPAGYYDGINDTVTATDADWIVSNIKTGVDVFGITGTYVTPLTGDAVEANVLDGKFFYKDDATSKLEGTMPNNAGDTAAASSHASGTSIHVVPATGYYDGSDDAATITDADFVAANIVNGTSIFGVTGTQSTLEYGLIGMWNFDGDANDSSGNGNNATNSGATWAADSPDGAHQCASFDGSNDYMSIDSLGSVFAGYNPWTLVLWIKTTLTFPTNYPTLIQAMPATGSAWNLRSINMYLYEDSGDQAYIEVDRRDPTNGISINLADQYYNDGDWHMIVAKYDGDTLYICGDNGSVTSSSTTNRTTTQAFYVWIGATCAHGEHYTGKMAAMRLYTRSLSATEITQLYNSGSGIYTTGTTPVAGDAAVGNVLTGKTFYQTNGATQLTGTMANNAGDVAAVSSHRSGTSIHVVPATGYTDGSDDASTITDADFVSRNIKSGIAIFGLTGELENGWEYPSDWPDVRDAAADSIEIAFCDAGTHTASFKVTTSAGQYHVDWGDTTTSDLNSDVLAEHVYTSGAGTSCTRGYTTWKITITAGSGNITRFYVVANSTQTNTNCPGYLAACFNTSGLTSLSNAFYSTTGAGVRSPMLEYFKFPTAATGVTTGGQYSFTNCWSLQKVLLTGLTGVTNATGMFNSCYSLQYADISMMTALATATSMFAYCYALKEIDTSAINTFTALDQFCRNCYSLRKATYNATLSSVTTIQYLHTNNFPLQAIDISGAVNATNADYAFQNCYELRTATIAGLTDITSMISCFDSCYQLETCTLTNVGSDAASTNATDAFKSCELLTSIALAGAKLTAIGAYGASSKLDKTTTITFSASSTFSSSTAPQFKIVYNDMSAAQLNTIFTDLPTATKTIDVTGCTGAATCDESIATAKNWTVTGA